MPKNKDISMNSSVEYHYIHHYIINKKNSDDYKSIFMNIIESSNYSFQFNLDKNSINKFFYDMDFEINEINLKYSDNKGCTLEISKAVVNNQEQSYFVIKNVSFDKESDFSYKLYFDSIGLPIKLSFIKPKELLKDLYLKTMTYEIDSTTLKVDHIWYFFEDERPVQEGVNGTIPMIIETPIKKIIQEDGSILKDVNLYDVHYFVFKSKELETIKLSDILQTCDISYLKMYGNSFTDFLRTSHMFNKRELELIRMAYI